MELRKTTHLPTILPRKAMATLLGASLVGQQTMHLLRISVTRRFVGSYEYLRNPVGRTYTLHKMNPPPKFNSEVSPKQWWLEDDMLSYWVSVSFQGRTVKLRGVNRSKNKIFHCLSQIPTSEATWVVPHKSKNPMLSHSGSRNVGTGAGGCNALVVFFFLRGGCGQRSQSKMFQKWFVLTFRICFSWDDLFSKSMHEISKANAPKCIQMS